MISLAWDLAPVAVGGLLVWTGAAKLLSRSLARQAAETALARVLNDARRGADAAGHRRARTAPRHRTAAAP